MVFLGDFEEGIYFVYVSVFNCIKWRQQYLLHREVVRIKLGNI